MAIKPPTLTLIEAASKPNPLVPPASLGKAGVEIWKSVHRDYIIEESGGQQVLLRICEAADSRGVIDSEIERDGPNDPHRVGASRASTVEAPTGYAFFHRAKFASIEFGRDSAPQ